MKSDKNGIYIPKKIGIVMILASVGINILFLLMGMVIGREDVTEPDIGAELSEPVEVVDTENKPSTIENEISIFDGKENRKKPIDVSYLSKTEKKTTAPVQEQNPEVKKPVAVSKPAEQTPPRKGFYIQVIVSSDAQKAKKIEKDLQDKGHNAFIRQEGNLHKVCVGSFENKKVADMVKSKIDKTMKAKSWVREW